METTTHTFHVSGTHCASCKILIEDILSEDPTITGAHVNLAAQTVTVETEHASDPEVLAQKLSAKVSGNGYRISVNKHSPPDHSNDTIWKALPIGLGILMGFLILQRSGILDLGIGHTTTPFTGLLIGLIASVSSCLAIVGGLVLSLAAKLAETDARAAKKPLILFHVARLVGFAILGGLLGMIGGVIGVDLTISATLGILTSLIMIALGLNLTGVLKSTFTLSPRFFNFFRKSEQGRTAPILLGVGTFVLPCGFTQAMQVAALSSGSFLSGSLIMFSFAIGTLPVLALLSFGSISFARSKYAPLFFASAGVVVIGLGLLSLFAGLAALGFITPLFTI